MKTIYKKLLALKDVQADDFPHALSVLLMVFFLIFGVISLYILLNTRG